MNYILIGFLISIGFGLGKIIISIMEEIIFNNLHEANWYKFINRKPDKKKKKHAEKTKIGF